MELVGLLSRLRDATIQDALLRAEMVIQNDFNVCIERLIPL